jgi:hypothetical protein
MAKRKPHREFVYNYPIGRLKCGRWATLVLAGTVLACGCLARQLHTREVGARSARGRREVGARSARGRHVAVSGTVGRYLQTVTNGYKHLQNTCYTVVVACYCMCMPSMVLGATKG